MQKLAVAHHWYVAFPPFDTFMHFLGGLCIALSIQYVIKKPTYIIPLTFLVGIGWEVLELYFDIAGHPFGTLRYNINSTKDLIMDTLGAVLVYFIVRKK